MGRLGRGSICWSAPVVGGDDTVAVIAEAAKDDWTVIGEDTELDVGMEGDATEEAIPGIIVEDIMEDIEDAGVACDGREWLNPRQVWARKNLFCLVLWKLWQQLPHLAGLELTLNVFWQ